jgi:hypothetical protein
MTARPAIGHLQAALRSSHALCVPSLPPLARFVATENFWFTARTLGLPRRGTVRLCFYVLY